MTERKILSEDEKRNDINILLDAEMMDAVVGGRCDSGCSKACASQCKHACATSSKTVISLPPLKEVQDSTVVKHKLSDSIAAEQKLKK